MFLFLLGLSQVDMDALMHMSDDDLKAMLIPMVSSRVKLIRLHPNSLFNIFMLFFLTSCVFCFGDRGRRYFLRWDPNANSIVASTSAEQSPEVVRLSYCLNDSGFGCLFLPFFFAVSAHFKSLNFESRHL